MLRKAEGIIKEISNTIQGMTPHSPESVFRDWCECMALSIQNGCDLQHDSEIWNNREKRYLDIVSNYTKEEVQGFGDMLGKLTMAFEIDPFQDYLGQIYMEMFGGSKHLGQSFTPISVCKVCAALSIGNAIPQEVKTIGDECCGGGAMLIAACSHYQEHGVDYQKYLRIYAGDIDALCVYMTYTQLSLLGARAEVWHRDTLSRKTFGFKLFVTPMEMLLWPTKYQCEEKTA